MKVIDLLNKIANGEEVPEKIKYSGSIYEYVKTWEQYVHETTETPLLKEISAYNYSALNDEVEIIKEKKTIDDLNLTLEEIVAFQEAMQIFSKLENEEDKYSWQFKLYNYITNLQEEKERLLGCLEDLYSLYHYKFDKILEQIKVIGDADLSEYNFCKFMDKIKNIIKGSDKSE